MIAFVGEDSDSAFPARGARLGYAIPVALAETLIGMRPGRRSCCRRERRAEACGQDEDRGSG
jgi:hypothetical protein